MSMAEKGPQEATRKPRKRAGIFDIRMVIGLLLAIYGVVLTVTGLVGTSEDDLAKANDVNVNLWTGVGLLVASAVFFVWSRLRPVLVPTDNPDGDSQTH
jgi:hypothetical protein